MDERYNLEKAQEEARKMKDKIESGNSKNYNYTEAEDNVTAEKFSGMYNFWPQFSGRYRKVIKNDKSILGESLKSNNLDTTQYSQKRLEQTAAELCAVIDSVAMELGLDINEIKRLVAQLAQLRKRGIELSNADIFDPDPRVVEIEKEITKTINKLEPLLEPIYTRMLELGYTRYDLAL